MVGLGDTVDVGGHTRGIQEGAGGEEDGDGEFVKVVVEDKLG